MTHIGNGIGSGLFLRSVDDMKSAVGLFDCVEDKNENGEFNCSDEEGDA